MDYESRTKARQLTQFVLGTATIAADLRNVLDLLNREELEGLETAPETEQYIKHMCRLIERHFDSVFGHPMHRSPFPPVDPTPGRRA